MSSQSETDVRPAGSRLESELSPGEQSAGATATVVVVALLFIGYSLIAVPVPGVNEPHYLTKARAYAQPDWCQNDFFLQSSNAHAVFYFLAGPLTKVCSFEAVAIVGRVLSLLLFAVGWTMVGRRLGQTFCGTVSSAAVLCLVAMSGNFSGEWIIGGFESKVPAYGFAFMSIAYWLDTRQRPLLLASLKQGVTLGLSIALHPVVGAWFSIGFASSAVLSFAIFRKPHASIAVFLRNELGAALSALVFALPGLVPAINLAMAANVDEKLQDSANQIQVYWRLAHHLDPSSFSASSWVHTAFLMTLATLGLILSVRLEAGKPGQPRSNDYWLALTALLIVSLAIAGAGILVGWHSGHFTEIPDWQWRARFLRYYPFRFFDALLPCVVAMVVGSLSAVWLRTRRTRTIFVVLLSVGVAVAAAVNRPFAPAAYSSFSFEQWKQACEWLKQNSSPESLIMSPRESSGLKWYAERAEYVCFKDCPQDGPGIVEWNARLGRLFSWARASYDNERFDNKDLLKLNEQTGITYVLTRRLGPFESAPVFRNEIWRIYQVPD